MTMQPVVRAIDVGYGHVKFVTGRELSADHIECQSFPSRAPRAMATSDLSAGVMSKADVHLVTVGSQSYAVGHDVISSAGANDGSEILALDFALTDGYLARMYGALNYMLPYLPTRKIDWLILGLPNVTVNKMAESLTQRVVGKHIINSDGIAVEIANARVFPQPLGAFFDHGIRHQCVDELKTQVNLIVDPGYNTVDWLFANGLTVNAAKCGSSELGMSSVVRQIAARIMTETGTADDCNAASVISRIDAAICHHTPYRHYGKEIDLKQYLKYGQPVIEEAMNELARSVGRGDEIDNIFLAGGGAPMFKDALKRRFPHHEIKLIPDPQYANVRGFQFIGTTWAISAARAMRALHA